MTVAGLGIDGYMRVQKEAVYGTPVTSSMTLLPVKTGSNVNPKVMPIENANIISSRVKQAPDTGRESNPFTIIMNNHPSLVGMMLNFMFGAASSSAVGDGAYNHYWLQELTAQLEGAIFTLQSATGSNLAEQLTSCMIDRMLLESDNEGNVQLTFSGFAKDHTTDIARISSFSYPSLKPYSFAQVALAEDGLGSIDVNTLSLEILMNYTPDRYKIGDSTVKRNVFQTLPQINLSINIDADDQFLDAARAFTSYDFTITHTSTEEAGSTPTYYSNVFELPGCRMNPETLVEHDPERLSMDLEINCSYGGTTTNSGADVVMYEIRCTDDTATYTA